MQNSCDVLPLPSARLPPLLLLLLDAALEEEPLSWLNLHSFPNLQLPVFLNL